ncbi:TetR family transcriptional regulator [Mycolicibacterium litorale]|nr:TetR family transcriptional regulator [Mycolicibacterium litorale]
MAGLGRNTGHTTADEWLQAGFALLAEEGFTALRVDKLSARLGITKGSFYWHFADLAAFKGAMISAWAQWRDDDHRRFKALEELPPRERLMKMTSFLIAPRQWMLERAMREWARSDPAATRSVNAADRRTRAALRQAFRDLGFDDNIAEQRSQWLFAMSIGAVHLTNVKTPRYSRARREELIDFMLRP